jgi:TIR domain-containing protein
MADPGAGEKLKVFISYSRKDSTAFVDELVLGLEDRGFTPILDRHDIKPGEPWETRLHRAVGYRCVRGLAGGGEVRAL